ETDVENITKILAGDANNDGKVSISDAVAILQYLANSNKYPLEGQAKINADCDGIAGVTGQDAATIQQYDAGIIDSLPVK
ncbi:MAG: dockerin type I repeat-containing protein, partial [Ruminococcus sp.]|nr:dockerin type I repeat-containing protein [Ruminococcus sp.]